ncbi:MAG: valine--tRNA ligase, partial [Acidobacteriaceae bacterium]|nr:valine--tRNA ligase [Acidobacteriaceae bacterium]
EIPIILDDLADPEFGSGAVKVTPAHDPNDFEAGRRHNLPKIQVIDNHGRMTPEAGPYAGEDRFEARKRVVADLEARGLLEKIEDYALSVGRCSRCQTVVEPLISTQWFVRTKPLAEKALHAAQLPPGDPGSIHFIPDNWDATYRNWMLNIRDWCISRQLWWGHRIPAWHCSNCKEITVARTAPGACPHCNSTGIEQDTDVLDTWFSSGLWPFSTLGWPDQTADLAAYYPTSLMITGFDILFFWVARMIMLGLELTGEVPFRQVHMHGLVRDPNRQKMSKMKGNVIDPLDITARFGTDAVRISLLMGVAAGTDIVYTEEKLTSARGFANKIWNASSFMFMNMDRSGVDPKACLQGSQQPGSLDNLEDRWLFSRIHRVAESVNRAFENHRYHEVAETLWHFFWHDFCDWYVEIKKMRVRENSGLTNDWQNMLAAYATALRLMHPLMPFLTEELWRRLGFETSISLQPYPQTGVLDESAEREMNLLQNIITEARTLRQSLNLGNKPLDGTLYTSNGTNEIATSYSGIIERLANLKLAIKDERALKLEGAVRSTPDFDLLLNVALADAATQRARLEKEIQRLQKLITEKDRQLSNESFLHSAPPQIVASLKEKRADYQAQLDKSVAALQNLNAV